MDADDSEPRFIISVVDPTNVWGLVSDVLLSRLPFRHVHLKNKFGNLVPISELHVQYLNNDDALLRKRRPHAKQPVTWFRNPYALLVLVSGDSVEEYKQNVRDGLRRLLDPPVDPLGGPVEWIIVYVRPSTIDALSKGPSKVFAALRNDFSTRRRERCMRLDFSGGLVTGVDDLERQLRDAVKSTFEARAAAYDEEVRRLMAMRKAEGWSFSTLFLVKDSLAAMLEAAGCLEDALREYSELEACYSEAIANGGALAAHPFGGDEPGDDQACLLTAAWREMRGSVHERGAVPQFRFRQFLFACQARILLKLQRPTEVADRGMKFVAAFGELLADAQLPPQLREAWAFSACMSLVIALARLAPGASPSTSPSLGPTVSDAGHQLSTAATLAERLGRPLQRSASAGNIGDSPERKSRPVNGSASPSARSVASTSTAAPSEASDGSSLRLDALRAQRPVTLPQRPSRLDPSADRSRLGNAGTYLYLQPL
ncbi:Trafficking protein particle complex subunit 10 [Coccomyxa sp. Obi]|nr:Trafficking protein particle complex subunit 10 [Coccomyxa sp. Obi]